jgi:hypothetical protein
VRVLPNALPKLRPLKKPERLNGGHLAPPLRLKPALLRLALATMLIAVIC